MLSSTSSSHGMQQSTRQSSSSLKRHRVESDGGSEAEASAARPQPKRSRQGPATAASLQQDATDFAPEEVMSRIIPHRYAAFPEGLDSLEDAKEAVEGTELNLQYVDIGAVPSTKEEIKACAVRLFNAIVDMSQVDKISNNNAKRKSGQWLVAGGLYREEYIAYVSYKLVHEAIAMHTDGYSINLFADRAVDVKETIRACKFNKTKDGTRIHLMSFEERIQRMEETLRANKILAQDVLNGTEQLAWLIVRAPEFVQQRRDDSKKAIKARQKTDQELLLGTYKGNKKVTAPTTTSAGLSSTATTTPRLATTPTTAPAATPTTGTARTAPAALPFAKMNPPTPMMNPPITTSETTTPQPAAVAPANNATQPAPSSHSAPLMQPPAPMQPTIGQQARPGEKLKIVKRPGAQPRPTGGRQKSKKARSLVEVPTVSSGVSAATSSQDAQQPVDNPNIDPTLGAALAPSRAINPETTPNGVNDNTAINTPVPQEPELTDAQWAELLRNQISEVPNPVQMQDPSQAFGSGNHHMDDLFDFSGATEGIPQWGNDPVPQANDTSGTFLPSISDLQIQSDEETFRLHREQQMQGGNGPSGDGTVNNPGMSTRNRGEEQGFGRHDNGGQDDEEFDMMVDMNGAIDQNNFW